MKAVVSELPSVDREEGPCFAEQAFNRDVERDSRVESIERALCVR